jgi:hypothetical protein
MRIRSYRHRIRIARHAVSKEASIKVTIICYLYKYLKISYVRTRNQAAVASATQKVHE